MNQPKYRWRVATLESLWSPWRWTVLLAALLVGCDNPTVHLEVPEEPAGATGSPGGDGWKFVSGRLVSPTTADEYFKARREALEKSGAAATQELDGSVTSDDIRELARALDYDPQQMYDFVRNKIDYVPYFGSMKGATTTLRERSGNDFDQASLLIALLAESGHSASYQLGTVTVPNQSSSSLDMQHLLSVDPTTQVLTAVLADAGIPATVTEAETSMTWVTVRLEGGGAGGSSTCYFNPALKPYEEVEGIDVGDLVGYSRSDLLAAAGGTLTDNSLQGLDESALAAKLTEYSTRFAAGITATYPNAGTDEILGARHILEQDVEACPDAIDFPYQVSATFSDIPSEYLHTVRIQQGNLDATLATADLNGRRLSLTFTDASSAEQKTSHTSHPIAAQPVQANRQQASPELTVHTHLKGSTERAAPTNESVDFGTIPASGSSTWSGILSNPYWFTIYYRSSLVNNGSGAYSFLNGSGGEHALAPGQYYTLTVQMSGAGQAPGTKTATLRIEVYTSTTYGGYVDYDLTGRVAQDLNASSSCAPLTTIEGVPVDGKCTITNNGALTLSFSSTALSGGDSDKFTITSGGGTASIPPGGHLDIGIRYQSQTTGQHSTSLYSYYSYDGVNYEGPTGTPSGTTSDAVLAQLWLDDTLIATEPSPSSSSTLTLTTNKPYPEGNGTYNDYTFNYEFTRGGKYVVAYDMGSGPAGVQVNARWKKLLEYQDESSETPTDAETLESLNVIGLAWMQQVHLSSRLIGELQGVLPIIHSCFGLVGQTSGYYIDVANVVVSAPSRWGTPKAPMRFARTAVLFNSALEHGILQQLQANTPAVSTTKLFRINNAANDKFFAANASTWASIESQLTGYSDRDLARIQAAIDEGATVYLPANGALQEQDWKGAGYITYLEDDTSATVGMLIFGGLHGGYGAHFGNANSEYVDDGIQCRYVPRYELWTSYSRDPVDMQSGAFIYDHDDLQLGGKEPFGLKFHRSYSSANHHQPGALGFGWTHPFESRTQVYSDATSGLGGRLPKDASAMVVAALAAGDLMQDSGNLEYWVVGALTAAWGVDQLQNNAVSVRMLSQAQTHIKLPDGSFSAPPGVTAQLSWDGDSYVLKDRNDVTASFNPDGTLQAWRDADGNQVTLTFADGHVATATDAVGRTLTFQYSGDALTQVTDSAGRTIQIQQDSDRNLTQYTDPEGNRWNYAYDDGHRLVSVTDPLGTITVTNTFDSLGRVKAQTFPRENGATANLSLYFTGFRGIEEDPAGGRTIQYYDADGNNIETRDPLGNSTRRELDGQNHVIRQIDARGNATDYVYDGRHNVVKVTTADGAEQSFVYDSQDHLIQQIDALGNSAYLEYDARHHPVKMTDAMGGVSTRSYTSQGLLLEEIDPNGNQTVYTYDAYDNPATITRTSGGTEQFTWSAAGDMATHTDADGNTRSFTYDRRRLKTSETDPLGNTSSTVYDAAGQVIEEIDALGYTTRKTYTPTYKLDTLLTPDGGLTQYDYDTRDNLVRQIDPLGGVTEYIVDAAGRRIATLDPEGNQTTLSLDENGNVISATTADGATTVNEYDVQNRLVRVQDPLGNARTQSYDAKGREIERIDEAGKVTMTNYDALDRRTSITYPDGAVEAFTYDAVGNMTTFTDGSGNRKTFTYDGQKRVTSSRDGLGNEEQSTYDPAGNRIARLDAEGRTTTYVYDAANRLIEILYPDQTTVVLRYDAMGRLQQTVDAIGTSDSDFDAMGRLTFARDHHGLETQYVYDLNGRVTDVLYPSGHRVTYQLDANGRQIAVTDWDGHTTRLIRNARGRISQIEYANGVVGDYSFDLPGRLSAFAYQKDGTDLVRHTLARNSLGLKVEEEIEAGLEPQVTTTRTSAVSYDAADRTLDQTLTDQASVKTITFVHDRNGNMLRSDTRQFAFDFDNRVIALEDATLGQSIAYTYDAGGRRTQRSVTNGAMTRFVLDRTVAHNRVLAEYDGEGTLQQEYLWIDAGLLARVSSTGEHRYVHADELGNTIALSDSGGALSDQAAYAPFGEVLVSTGDDALPFGFAGAFGIYAEGEDLYFMQNRFYDASLGRFISPDPTGLNGGSNYYQYAAGNPLRYVDPLGLGATEPGLAAESSAHFDYSMPSYNSLFGSVQDFGFRALSTASSFASDVYDMLTDNSLTRYGSGLGSRAFDLQSVDAGAYTPISGTRLDAYAATVGNTTGTVGLGAHRGIGAIYLIADEAGSHSIGDIFQSSAARRTYSDTSLQSSFSLGSLEYDYWNGLYQQSPVRFSGPWWGQAFNPTVRAVGQLGLSYLPPWTFNP